MNISELLQGFGFAWFWLEEEKFLWSCSHIVLQSFCAVAQGSGVLWELSLLMLWSWNLIEVFKASLDGPLSNLSQWKDVPAMPGGWNNVILKVSPNPSHSAVP